MPPDRLGQEVLGVRATGSKPQADGRLIAGRRAISKSKAILVIVLGVEPYIHAP